MTRMEKWLALIDDATTEIKQRLITINEFNSILDGIVTHILSPCLGVSYEIIPGPPFDVIVLGETIDSEAGWLATLDLDELGTTCRIKIWKKSDGIPEYNASATNVALETLARSYWKSDRRQATARLISSGTVGTIDLIQNSVAEWSRGTEGSVFAGFFDLDKFKLVNDEHNHGVGDRVILEFSALVMAACGGDAVPIHRSGDEFMVLLTAADEVQALRLAQTLMESVLSYDFRVEPVQVGVSGGLVRLEKIIPYEELERRAEKVLVPDSQEKQRGKARLESLGPVPVISSDGFGVKTSLCLVKSSLDTKSPFESPWLNLVSQRAQESCLPGAGSVEEVASSVQSLLEWIKPSFVSDLLRTAAQKADRPNNQPTFSHIDVAFAVAHGLLRFALTNSRDFQGKSLQLQTNDAKNACLLLLPENVVLYSSPEEGETKLQIDIGGFVSIVDEDFKTEVPTA